MTLDPYIILVERNICQTYRLAYLKLGGLGQAMHVVESHPSYKSSCERHY